MRIIYTFILSLFFVVASGQDKTVKELQKEATRQIKKDAADTSKAHWKKGGIININLSQGSLNNWAAGGDNFSLSVNNLVSLFAFYKNDKYSWDNTLDYYYGVIKSTSLGNRKNDDRIDLFSKYGIALDQKWNVAALANFRTQLFKGYIYKDNQKSLASNLLAPAYLLLGAGLDYKPGESFSLYLSPATARFTFVNDDTLSAKGAYGVDPGKKSKFELGAFLSANYLKTFNKVLSYKSRLDLFSNYRHNPQNIDMYMTNILSINFTKVLSATWNVDLIYDDDVRLFGKNNTSAALQLKSLIGVGFLLKLGGSKG